MSLWVIVLAGGSGQRLDGGGNKVLLPVGGRPILDHSLDTFRRSPLVSGLVLVTRPEDFEAARGHLRPGEELVAGGASRHQSEYRGLEALAVRIEDGEADWVAVHDAARPFVTVDLLAVLMTAAERHGGAVPGLAPAGPLYRRSGDEARPLQDPAIRRVQTPQLFRSRELLAAHRRAAAKGFEGVDTAETAERFSDLAVALVPGDPRNLKITYAEDLEEAERLGPLFESGSWLDSAS